MFLTKVRAHRNAQNPQNLANYVPANWLALRNPNTCIWIQLFIWAISRSRRMHTRSRMVCGNCFWYLAQSLIISLRGWHLCCTVMFRAKWRHALCNSSEGEGHFDLPVALCSFALYSERFSILRMFCHNVVNWRQQQQGQQGWVDHTVFNAP